MTTAETIACGIAWIAVVVACTVVQLLRARRQNVARYDVEWRASGGVFTARGLTEGEFDRLMKRLKSEGYPDA